MPSRLLIRERGQSRYRHLEEREGENRAEEHKGMPMATETGREKEWILLRAILTSDLRPLKLWQSEFCCLKPLICGNLLWQPQKASAGPSTGEDGGCWHLSSLAPKNSSMVGGDGGGRKVGKTHHPTLWDYLLTSPLFYTIAELQFGAGIVHSHTSSSQTGHTLWMGWLGWEFGNLDWCRLGLLHFSSADVASWDGARSGGQTSWFPGQSWKTSNFFF